MRRHFHVFWMPLVWACLVTAAGAADGNRLAYLDEFCDPYWVGLDTPKLTTPQWVGEPGVEAVVVLSTDDLADTARFEKHLRPIYDRLKQIDGRSPASMMATHVDLADPQLQKWLADGISLECHTYDHPCPCLHDAPQPDAKETFDRCLDLMCQMPGSRPVAFRTPCCDSINSFSPRLVAEIFNKVTPNRNFLELDSSVFQVSTSADPALPRELLRSPNGLERLARYLPAERKFVNYVENYPYPYVIARLCWEIPGATPDDWQGYNRNGMSSHVTLADMKAALDCVVIKRGQFTLVFHTNNWLGQEKAVELVDYAAKKYGPRIKFLSFRDVRERLTKNLLAGHPLRAADGRDNGVRVLDVNGDGYMDVVIGNERVRQTRIWIPQAERWQVTDLPVPLVWLSGDGKHRDGGVRFGVLRPDGMASLLVRRDATAGLWHFDGQHWVLDPRGLDGLMLDRAVATGLGSHDLGVRLRDLDGDGICELVVGNAWQNAVFAWQGAGRGWRYLNYGLPENTALVDSSGRDAGLRFVDVTGDGRADVVFSNAERFSCHAFVSLARGWSRTLLDAKRAGPEDLPMIVRDDGSNNGVWFTHNAMWIQNESTGRRLRKGVNPLHPQVESRSFQTDFGQ